MADHEPESSQEDDRDIDPGEFEGLRLAISSLLRFLPRSRAALQGLALYLSCHTGNYASQLLSLIPDAYHPSPAEMSAYLEETEELEAGRQRAF